MFEVMREEFIRFWSKSGNLNGFSDFPKLSTYVGNFCPFRSCTKFLENVAVPLRISSSITLVEKIDIFSMSKVE